MTELEAKWNEAMISDEQWVTDRQTLLEIAGMEAPIDFHEMAVQKLLETVPGDAPAFGNMAGELARKMEEEHEQTEQFESFTFGGFGGAPVVVKTPVHIQPKKRRPLRAGDDVRYGSRRR